MLCASSNTKPTTSQAIGQTLDQQSTQIEDRYYIYYYLNDSCEESWLRQNALLLGKDYSNFENELLYWLTKE